MFLSSPIAVPKEPISTENLGYFASLQIDVAFDRNGSFTSYRQVTDGIGYRPL